MTFHVFLSLLLCFLLVARLWLCRLYVFHGGLAHWRAEAVHPVVHRLLKPRPPHDCPACCHSSIFSPGARPSPLPVRPWGEVTSRRGAPKRLDTQGYACPNQQCPSFGITDADIHALLGDGKHGHAEQIQTFGGPACRTTFTSRRNTPLSRLKTPSRQIAMVLAALAEGLDPSAAERVAGLSAGDHHEPFWLALGSTRRPYTSASSAISGSRICSWMNCAPGCAQQVLWLWLAIDPCTKLIPVLHVGPRTPHMAQRVIHSPRQILAAFLHPPFHQ